MRDQAVVLILPGMGRALSLYFGMDGDTVIILLGGGSSKQRQQQAIEAAKERWADYRSRRGK